MRAMMDAMEGRLAKRFDNVAIDVKKNATDIQEVRQIVSDTETNLLERMDKQKRHLEDMIRSSVPCSSGASRLSPKCEETYWHFRKSLSVWPIPGDYASAGLKLFLVKKLHFTKE